MCANNMITFIENGGYDLEERVEMSGLAPSLAVKTSQRTTFRHCENTTPPRNASPPNANV